MNIVKNKAKHLCKVSGCRNKCRVIKRNGKKNFTKYCHRCAKRAYKENNLIGYVYSTLKNNARRRGKEFKITIDEFRNWCAGNDYINKRGRFGTSAQIDRKNAGKGYTLDNIQVITNSQNLAKHHSDYAFYKQHGYYP